MRKIFTLLLFAFILSAAAFADSVEIVGAEMTYAYTGNSNYQVKLVIYSHCTGSSSTIGPVWITVSSPDSNFTSYRKSATVTQDGAALALGQQFRYPIHLRRPIQREPRLPGMDSHRNLYVA